MSKFGAMVTSFSVPSGHELSHSSVVVCVCHVHLASVFACASRNMCSCHTYAPKYVCVVACLWRVVMYSDCVELRGSHVSPGCYARLIFSMCVLCVCVFMPSVCLCVFCVFLALHAVTVCVNSVVNSDRRKMTIK